MLYRLISKEAFPPFSQSLRSKQILRKIVHVHANSHRADANSQLRIAAYEVLNTFVTNAAHDCVTIVAQLLEVILQRLEGTIPMQQQIVSIDDKMVLEEMQTSLSSCTVVSHTMPVPRNF